MYVCMFVFTYIQFSQKDQDILGIIGQVLVPISLVCMVLIILTYTCMRYERHHYIIYIILGFSPSGLYGVCVTIYTSCYV